jgi:hypothetical protein
LDLEFGYIAVGRLSTKVISPRALRASPSPADAELEVKELTTLLSSTLSSLEREERGKTRAAVLHGI